MVEYPVFDDEYFARAATRIHLNSLIVIPLNSLAAFLVLQCSPPTIGVYKYYLLSIVLWSVVLDLFTTIFFVPIPIFPAPALCSYGPFDKATFPAAYQFAIFLALLIGSAISLVVAFLYRYLRVKNRSDILHSYSGILTMFLSLVIFSTVLDVFMLIGYFQTGEVNSYIQQVIYFEISDYVL